MMKGISSIAFAAVKRQKRQNHVSTSLLPIKKFSTALPPLSMSVFELVCGTLFARWPVGVMAILPQCLKEKIKSLKLSQ